MASRRIRTLQPGKVDRALASGIGYVPEDRHARGFVPSLGVAENLTLPLLDRLSRFGIVSAQRRADAAERLVSRLQVVARDDQPVAELSGGNQQKVVVGRAFSADPSLLVVVSPTVGVDVASKEALLGVVEQATTEGTAVLPCWTTWRSSASARACSSSGADASCASSARARGTASS